MQCSQVEELLSQYVDDALDPSTRRRMERHLEECPRCGAELEELHRYLQAMKNLDAVRAPADFLEKIHQRIEAQSLWRRFFSKLFVPMRVKLPLEFAGVLVTAVLLVVSYQHLVLHKRPVIDSGSSESVRPPAAFMKMEREGPRKLQEKLGAPSSPSPASPARESGAIHLRLVLKSPQGPAAAETGEEDDLPALPPRDGTDGAGAIVCQQKLRQKSAPLSAPPADEFKNAKKDELSAFAVLQEKRMQLEARATPTDVFSAIKDHVKQLDGDVLSVEKAPAEGRPASITIQIPAKNYQALLDLLLQLGRFEPLPPKLPGSHGDQWELLKINLIITQ